MTRPDDELNLHARGTATAYFEALVAVLDAHPDRASAVERIQSAVELLLSGSLNSAESAESFVDGISDAIAKLDRMLADRYGES